jgi:hypothetical protein
VDNPWTLFADCPLARWWACHCAPADPLTYTALDKRLGFLGHDGESGKTFGAGTRVERILTRRGRAIIQDARSVVLSLSERPGRREA